MAEHAPQQAPRPARPVAPSVAVIGVGNALRHDDAAGLELVPLVRGRLAQAGCAVVAHEGDTLGLLECFDGAGAAVIVDATRSGAPAGTLTRIDASAAPLPAELPSSASTHAMGLADALELARALGRLPARVVVYGIEGARFDAGAGLSQPVRDALPKLAERVAQEAERVAGEADALSRRPAR